MLLGASPLSHSDEVQSTVGMCIKIFIFFFSVYLYVCCSERDREKENSASNIEVEGKRGVLEHEDQQHSSQLGRLAGGRVFLPDSSSAFDKHREGRARGRGNTVKLRER